MSAPKVWPLWFEQMAVHQDYAWFLALLGWGLAVVLWRRHPQRGDAWAWVPWTALALVVGAAVQFGIFNPPFDFFHSRLRPGTLGDYAPALIDAELLGAWLILLAFAGWAAGWGWQLWRHSAFARWGWLIAAGAIATWHIASPPVGALLLAVLLTVQSIALARRQPAATVRRALALVTFVPWFSTVGPLAVWLGQLQQSGPPTAMGLAAALVQIVGGASVACCLWPAAVGARPGERASRLRYVGLLWLVLGVLIAHQTGADNRRELQRNRLRQAAARAQLLNERILSLLDLPLPNLDRLESTGGRVEVPPESQPDLAEISEFVARELRATLYVAGVRIVALAGDWLIVLADSDHPLPAGRIEVLRRATERDREDWARARNVIERSPLPEIGRPYYCRAAVTARDGRMLAWLEHEQVEFFQSIERKWRSGPLLVTALGWLLGMTLWLQRRSEREREAAVRAAAVQEEASRVKSAFLAMVSHELRTPLQSFLGYGELLRARHAADPQSTAWLEAMRQHGEMMARLVNDLIDLGAADAGTLRLRTAPASPGEIVRHALEGLRVKAEAKGLRLRGEIAAAVPARVELDAARWGEVVFNLVGNAVKFTGHGGVEVRLDARDDAGMVVLALTVADTGPGIAPELQPRLFQAFSRLESTAHHEGAGVGLALSAALCRAMGGELTVESDGKSGTTFRATVRVARAADAEVAATAAARPLALPGRRVLVVDDNRLVRELFQAMLADAGAQCLAVGSAAEAETALRQTAFDAVVLDVSLPDVSGIELAPRLRDMRHGLRIVGASAHAGEGERLAALAAGMDAFLIKPVARAELLAALGAAGVGNGWGGGPQREIEALFRAEAPRDLERMAAAWTARDWPALRAAAHYVANSAAVVGDLELRDECERLVRAAEARDAALAEPAWLAVEQALRRWGR